jgi:chromosome segregation ATPase
LFPFHQALHLMRARIFEKAAEVQQCSCVAEQEETNTQLWAELAAAHTKVEEVERREQALTSDYAGLRSDFSELQTADAAVAKEKADLEKRSATKCNNFATCYAKSWSGFAAIWRNQ